MIKPEINPTYTPPSKGLFFIHFALYLVVMAILWTHYVAQNTTMHGGAYPWEAWFTGSWFIFLLGHFCNTFFDNNANNSDKQYLKYLKEKVN
ncbi:MAG TPA: 2TM domain-containing protein [Chitinophagaceae bacterium]|nr:2TM domain-containing protein [Chitinophagaceae bacterium]